MNINEYKRNKIKEIKEFLKGIKFENIGIKDKKIILGLTPECSDFFNKDEVYRNITESFLNKIYGYYIELIDTNIEYATSIEEIDFEVKKFEDKVRNETTNYKNSLIKAAFTTNKEEQIVIEELPEVKEKNLLNTGLNFIKIKIGDKVYSTAKTGGEAEKEDVEVENLSHMIIYIYILINNIQDKKEKQEEFIDFIAENFSVKDKEYIELRKLQGIFLNEKNYESFLQKYSKVIEEITTMIKARENKISEGTKGK